MAIKNGNRFSLIPQTIKGWYQEFRKLKVQNSSTRGIQNRKRPPVLEGTQENNFTVRGHANMRDFGQMTPDEQAEALIKMGYLATM